MNLRLIIILMLALMLVVSASAKIIIITQETGTGISTGGNETLFIEYTCNTGCDTLYLGGMT